MENSTSRRESHYLEASCSHHEFHMVWKQTRVPSLSKMTRPGLKALSCARSAWLSRMEGDTELLPTSLWPPSWPSRLPVPARCQSDSPGSKQTSYHWTVSVQFDLKTSCGDCLVCHQWQLGVKCVWQLLCLKLHLISRDVTSPNTPCSPGLQSAGGLCSQFWALTWICSTFFLSCIIDQPFLISFLIPFHIEGFIFSTMLHNLSSYLSICTWSCFFLRFWKLSISVITSCILGRLLLMGKG